MKVQRSLLVLVSREDGRAGHRSLGRLTWEGRGKQLSFVLREGTFPGQALR